MPAKKRRTKGDGALFQRADGTWIGSVELPPSPDGKRRRKRVASRDRNRAIAELKKLRADVDAGRIAVTGNTTVGKWLDHWIQDIHRKRDGRPLRPTTRRDYVATIRAIKAQIGDKRLDKLTPQHVRDMTRGIGETRAAEKAYVLLRKALDDAIKEQMITRNVAEVVYRPVYTRGTRTALSFELAQRIIATAFRDGDVSRGTRWAAAFLTGCRQAELLGLTWDRVDLEHAVMRIDRQLQQLSQVHGCGVAGADGTYPCGRTRPGWCPQRRWDLPANFPHEVCRRSLVWTPTKTAAGDRWVPILAPLLTRLRELHDADGRNPHNLVWHHDDGRPIGPRDDYADWQRLLIEAEVIAPGETLSMHVARHTTATLLRKAGVDEQTRMEIIGHATLEAQRIYAHADRQRHAEAMHSGLGKLMAIGA
jgi:integrase